ncbi:MULTISPECIES: tetratricopeptide repeat protein [Zhenhengia]|uniref:tetratricopeptide repeat protein n=1 Tax=Zhenhengia TaxID=2944196 RepID=UPI002A7576F1|nr:tetratricopeptide repeat protein [Zhenhengia yiwuensis]MBS5799482.1 hypothetical protein [Clostridiales bacterium]MDY3369431.1 hypothetical protein [Zhenhengia yiwuensis]
MQVKCPYCNHEVEALQYCEICEKKIDWIIGFYEKSQYYYNKGYGHAALRELSLAIPNLEKAIYYNKYNIQAKNLLGLIYFEIGQVSLALKSWILSEALCKEDNLASTYIEKLQNHPKQLESYKDSIVLYNRALHYMQKKNDDMAIIRLKKAIHINPNFLEARNLLALCYIYQKQNHKALPHLHYVLRKDGSNTKALHFLKEIEMPQEEIEEMSDVIIEAPHINDLDIMTDIKPQKVINRGGIFGHYVLYFLFGALCMFGIQVGLITPNKTAQLEQELYDRTTENTSIKVQLDTFMQDYETKIGKLTESNTKLLAENENLKQEYMKISQESKLWEVRMLRDKGDMKGAAEVLNNISVSDLKEDKKTLYEELKASIYPKAGEAFYNEGYKLYKAEQYIDAMIQFEKTLIFIPKTKNGGNALYYMGQIEENNKNISKALQYYQIVLKDYTETPVYKKAQERVKELETQGSQ